MTKQINAAQTALSRILQRHQQRSSKIGKCQWKLAYNQQRYMASSSASIHDFPVPERVKNTVKSTFLNKASKENSSLWVSEKSEVNHRYDTPFNGAPGGVNDTVTMQHDPLDDWSLERSTKYWPELPPGLVDPETADPFALANAVLADLSRSIREDLLGTDHPVLNKAAAYFFDDTAGGKKVRPMMVLLMSRALADSATKTQQMEATDTGCSGLFSTPLEWQREDLPQAQRRLGEISEMIHTASLFHDDVIDGADTRRGLPAVHTTFGNKVAILAGDYLLARASICLARLRHTEVIETMSTIIEHLVRGEIMQLRGTSSDERNRERMVYYLRKNFYKTGSLMANSCKSAALLGDYPPEIVSAAYRYGKHVGIAFQLVDDVLDFEGTASDLGKPALSDLKAGLATAPVLLAAQEYPELEEMMDRKFKSDGDVELATELVFASSGIERTKELARVHAELSMESLLELEGSPYRDALIHLAYKVVSRTK